MAKTANAWFVDKSAILGTLVIFAVTLLAYGRTLDYGFIYLDDDFYFQSPLVTQFNLSSIAAFFHFQYGNWTPLTWLSHNLIYQIFGPNLFWHHLANVLFHAANSVLVALLTRDLIERFAPQTTADAQPPWVPLGNWAALLIGILYAVHPQHVEAVAWLAARKDLLATFFALLASRHYLRNLDHQSLRANTVLNIWFSLSLMAKPVLVALPLALMVFDWLWGLHRGITIAEYLRPANGFRLDRFYAKLPLFFVSLASGLLAYFGQDDAGALSHLDYSLFTRLCFIASNVAHYVGQFLLVSNVQPMYPIPKAGDVSAYPLLSMVILVTLSYVALPRRVMAGLVSAFSAYVILLLPVSGIMFVGMHATADRFAYSPMIPLFLLAGAGLHTLLNRLTKPDIRKFKNIFTGAIAIVLLISFARTVLYVGAWRTATDLWSYALIRNPNDIPAMTYLGASLLRTGRASMAIPVLERAARESMKRGIEYGGDKLFYTYIIALHEAGKKGDALQALERAKESFAHSPTDLKRIEAYETWIRGTGPRPEQNY